MDRELISNSRFLSLVLRHHPEKTGISLDEEGWVEVGDLLAASNRSGKKLTRPLLERVSSRERRVVDRFSSCGVPPVGRMKN